MIELISEWCSHMLFYCLIYSGLWVIVERKDSYSILGIICIACISILSILAKRLVKNFILSISAICIVMISGFAFGYVMLHNVTFCITMVIAFIILIIGKIVENIINFPYKLSVLGFILGIFIYILASYFKYKILADIMFGFIFVHLLLIIFIRNYSRIKQYIEPRRISTIMSERKMKRYFYCFMSIFVGCIIGIMLICKVINYDGVYESISGFFNINKNVEYQGEDDKKETNDEIDTSRLDLSALKVKPTIFGVIFRVILKLFIVLALIIISAAFIYCIIKVYRGLSWYKKKGMAGKKEFLFASVEIRESIEKGKHKSIRKEVLSKEPKDRIRKLYKKNMRGFKKFVSPNENCYTPTEQRSVLKQQGYLIDEGAINLYEEARYSNREITKEDVKHMEALLAKNK